MEIYVHVLVQIISRDAKFKNAREKDNGLNEEKILKMI